MNKEIDLSNLINLTQAARYLGKSYMTLYRWRKSGKLKVVYIGGMPYVALGELIQLKEKQEG
ncbi:MAG: helix-turn-helix domain-containing protein [bacterium]|nr:helix-turn-helix domain-containing protein [bacterium]